MYLKLYCLSAILLVMTGTPVYSTELCTTLCLRPLSSLCGDQTLSGLCADDITAFINNSVSRLNQNCENTNLTVNVMKLASICGANKKCQGGTVVGTTFGFKVQLFQGERNPVCKGAGWYKNTFLEVYGTPNDDPSKEPIITCQLRGLENLFSQNLMPKCNSSMSHTGKTSNTYDDAAYMVVEDSMAVEITTSQTSQNNSIRTSQIPNCLDTRETKSDDKFKGSDVAMAAGFSFTFGMASVLAVFVLMQMRREQQLCFRERDCRSPGKMWTASDTATNKVIHMIKDKKTANVDEDTGVKNNTSHDEHVYCDLDKRKHGCESSTPVIGRSDISNPTYEIDSEDVFEHERESAADQHAYFVLENDNFRIGEKVGDVSATCEDATAGDGTHQAGGEKAEGAGEQDTMYFVLEKGPQ